MSASKDPLGIWEESEAVSRTKQELEADDQACLKKIKSLRRKSLQEPDDLPAILTYFATRNLELDLEFLSDIRRIVSNRTKPLYEMPELLPMFAAHLGLSRHSQRDLDHAERFRQSKHRDANDRGSRSKKNGFKSVEKPR